MILTTQLNDDILLNQEDKTAMKTKREIADNTRKRQKKQNYGQVNIFTEMRYLNTD